MLKNSIWLDFDGVIHSYTSGWHGIDIILDPPVEGAIEAIREYLKCFTVMIFSSRNSSDNAITAMRRYLFDNGLSEEDIEQLEFPKDKPAALVGIDDRAITFRGVFPTVEVLLSFKPWNR